MLSTFASVKRATVSVTRRPAFLSAAERYFSDEGPKKAVRKVKKKPKKSTQETGGRPKDLEIILAALDAPFTKAPPADKEEMARREQILKNYTVGKFKQHNQENHDLACKLTMKKHAIKMLPKGSELKRKALEVDNEGPPRWRNIPLWTPPIPNFNYKDYTTLDE
ncbi:unnamed protein product [Cylindrotheca closterium]|uniref:Uncharacterized protein n=1 Tax=Cylindrotheca closterium TaxID=2856 RepID=A0AAD2GAV0_9STRA|nr:unnamed protein product [Cylindrotheca closterium]